MRTDNTYRHALERLNLTPLIYAPIGTMLDETEADIMEEIRHDINIDDISRRPWNEM